MRPVLIRRVATLGAIVALTVLGTGGLAHAAALPRADRQFVDATVAQAMQSGRLPGVTIKLSGPKGSYEKTYGVADVASNRPIAVADHVRIASITKTFTATAVLRQVQRGRLSLSDKLARWVKGIPNGRRISVRQLLAMRSGIYDFTSDAAFNQEFRRQSTDVVQAQRHHPDHPAAQALFEPGARTQYADSNYVLLGIILERVTGRSVESVITRDVIDRAGLRQTSFPTKPALPRPFSHGYYAGPDGDGEIRDYTAVNPKVAWTAGGMVSTLDDLKKWGKALATGTLINRRLQAQRLRFGTIPNAGGPPVGYGLGILRFGDWLGHDGAIFGFSTATFYERSSGAQIVAIANLSSNFSTPTLEIFGAIAQHLYPESLEAG